MSESFSMSVDAARRIIALVTGGQIRGDEVIIKLRAAKNRRLQERRFWDSKVVPLLETGVFSVSDWSRDGSRSTIVSEPDWLRICDLVILKETE